MTTFRIHFAQGEPLEIQAETAGKARETAKAARPGAHIRKIKVLKEAGRG